jgi:hypothetical protein
MNTWSLSFLTFLLLATATSCYRMPTDDDYSVIPMTNNPDLQRRESKQSMMPSVGY